ncbi:DUF4249 domain-containing protein [Marinoscillum pacificum]|uniref:DUF4249 domain-containing protein n=1 Tax=Marinoscillum pacificum TaxID=392723 RepID=UPI0021576524|nr:DUF4249 domain-containing protein [Marinoscillum pacificum]
MKVLKNLLFVMLLGGILSYCSIPIDSESFGYRRSVVVDGMITDEYKTHKIRLSYTSEVNNGFYEAISDADVKVVTGSGQEYFFQLGFDGYYGSEEEFAGIPGETYQLQFTIGSDRGYSSNEIELIASPPIDSIYDRYAELSVEGSDQYEGGIQFFLDTHDDTNQAQNYLYEWTEDYKIVTPKVAFYKYLSQGVVPVLQDSTSVCYGYGQSSSILITQALKSGNRVVEFPIRFISGLDDFLRNRYSISVKQYAISASSYGYYRQFKELNESGGSLFDQQRGTLVSNVTSFTDPDEIVLGYFDVAGVSEKRVFFNYDDLDPNFPRPGYRAQCYSTELSFEDFFMFFTPTMDLTYYEEDQQLVRFQPPPCTDCTSFGPTEAPEYWIE